METDFNRWHKLLAGIVGEIGYALVKRTAKRSKMTEWVATLEKVLDEIRRSIR
jgi:hypothetical protein